MRTDNSSPNNVMYTFNAVMLINLEELSGENINIMQSIMIDKLSNLHTYTFVVFTCFKNQFDVIEHVVSTYVQSNLSSMHFEGCYEM